MCDYCIINEGLSIFRSSMSEVQKKDKVAAQKEGKVHIYSKDWIINYNYEFELNLI